MNYINKNTGDKISFDTYCQLTREGKLNFIKEEVLPVNQAQKTHTITELKSDSLSVGDAIAVVALSPLIILKSIF